MNGRLVVISDTEYQAGSTQRIEGSVSVFGDRVVIRQ
jgi:hypothetical protein